MMTQKLMIQTAGLDGKDAETVRFAGQELRKYLSLVSEDSILLCETDLPCGGIRIGVALSDELPAVADPRLDDAILLDVDGGAGIITGTNARSVLIAVYRYLREMGFVFIRPGKNGEIYPATLPQKAVRVCEAASYRDRGICMEGSILAETAEDMVDWIPKVGMNSYFIQFFVPGIFYRRWYEHADRRYANPLLPVEPLTDDEIIGMSVTLEREIQKRGLLFHNVGHGWTCKPFGLPSTGWNAMDPADVPEDARQYFAMIDGERKLNADLCPLNTNLCYGNPETRRKMADAIVSYSQDHPQVDYLHIWLADGSNNHCTCPLCRDTRPSDFYVMLLNEIDERLTAIDSKQKIVFLMYVDLMWAPVAEKLKNKDRFLMIFAPITRSYSAALADTGTYTVPPYIRNRLTFPEGTDANIAFLHDWRRVYDGQCGVFDYYYMWDCYLDFGNTGLARLIHEDIGRYAELGFSGLISCQGQRVFCPTSLGMNIMARTLWDRNCDFDTVRDEVMRAEFGDAADEVKAHLEEMTRLSCSEALRYEKPFATAENAAAFRKAAAKARRFAERLPAMREKAVGIEQTSLRYLQFYTELTALVADGCAAIADGDTDSPITEAMNDFLDRTEWDMREYFDAFEYKFTFVPRIERFQAENKEKGTK